MNRRYFVVALTVEEHEHAVGMAFSNLKEAIGSADYLASQNPQTEMVIVQEVGAVASYLPRFRPFEGCDSLLIERKPADFVAKLSDKIAAMLIRKRMSELRVSDITRCFHNVDKALAQDAIDLLIKDSVVGDLVIGPRKGRGRPTERYLVNQEILSEYTK